MTKFLSIDWMIEHNFIDWSYYKNEKHPLSRKSVSDLNLKPIQYFNEMITVEKALEVFETG